MSDRNRVIRVTTWIAAAVAVAVTILMPLGYFTTSYERIEGQLEAEAEINSRIVTGLINANPDMWRYEQLRLEELLAKRPGSGEKETRRILDIEGKVIAESVSQRTPPLIMVAVDLKDAGVTVGRIEISRSLIPLLARSGLMALLGLSLGVGVFIALRVLPIRAMMRAEEELRRLNEDLELKVEERTKQLVDAQEELVRKEKLSILGQLAGGVGHELRNPLGVMSNAVYFLKMVLAEADETTKEYLEIIKHEIDNSMRIITDLLDFTRTKTPQTRAVPARDLVEESLGRCAIPENVELHTELQNTLPALKVDPLQMGQVFQNLITNAVQAMPEGGELRIAARVGQGSGFKAQNPEEENIERGTLNVEPDGDFAEISVTDTGTGIAPENMEKVFQPLFTTKSRGIGLGLVVCRNLTEANGGRIEVESEMGKGTTVTVKLPVDGCGT